MSGIFHTSSEIEEDGETVTGVQGNREKHGGNAGAVIRRGLSVTGGRWVLLAAEKTYAVGVRAAAGDATRTTRRAVRPPALLSPSPPSYHAARLSCSINTEPTWTRNPSGSLLRDAWEEINYLVNSKLTYYTRFWGDRHFSMICASTLLETKKYFTEIGEIVYFTQFVDFLTLTLNI